MPVHLLYSVRPTRKKALVSGSRDKRGVGTVATESGVCCVGFRSGQALHPCLFVDGVFSAFTGCRASLYLFTSSNSSMSITVGSGRHLSRVLRRLSQCTTAIMGSRVYVLSTVNGVR